uniref:Uncharacterized protein n=1 Tax=Oryzias melastigma TaxID=30732 RepID=A0A3B3BG79_ORYME
LIYSFLQSAGRRRSHENAALRPQQLHVQDLLGRAAAAQPVPACPPADGGVPQRRQEDLHGHRLSDEPGHGEVQLGEIQGAALPMMSSVSQRKATPLVHLCEREQSVPALRSAGCSRR